MRKLTILFLVLGILFSCNEGENEEVFKYNPVFKAKFIDNDSLNDLANTLENLESDIKIHSDNLQKVKSEITLLDEKITTIGGDSVPTWLENKTALEETQTFLNDKKNELDSTNRAKKANRDSVASGWLVISAIRNALTGVSEAPDTSNVALLPLPLTSLFAAYELDIKDSTYSFEVDFLKEKKVNNNSEIIFSITDLEIKNVSTNLNYMGIDEDIHIFNF